jgi:hypothetical protein
MEATIHYRHLRLLAFFRRIRKGQGITGRIEYPRWFSLDQSIIELLGFALLYVLLFLLTDELAILGGEVFCGVIALRHWLWSRKEYVENRVS